MVYIKALKDEIVDNEYDTISNAILNVGAAGGDRVRVITLFDKQDVLINKIEKLPVLVGIQINFSFGAELNDRLVAGAVENMRAEIRIYNGEADLENLIVSKNAYMTNGGGVFMIFVDSDPTKKICNLLGHQITELLYVYIDDVVAGAAIPADLIKADIIYDINWVKITADELKDYAVEQLYVKQ